MASLRDLGLSEYEATAYRKLLRLGPATAPALSDASGVPMGRIYDVLEGLAELGMIRCRSQTRPKQYAAVEPEAALDRLLDARIAELHERIDGHEQTVAELKETLPTGRRDPGEQFWATAVGTQDAVDLLLDRITAAVERLDLVVAAPVAAVDRDSGRLVDHLGAALDREVETRVLADADLADRVDDEIVARYREEIADHPNLAVRNSDDLHANVGIVDDLEVCVEIPDPFGEDLFGAVALRDAEFTAEARDRFETRWQAATPAE
ncbi:MAG: TrmB family transcriptional regulator [Halobacteriaceae archaeon]